MYHSAKTLVRDKRYKGVVAPVSLLRISVVVTGRTSVGALPISGATIGMTQDSQCSMIFSLSACICVDQRLIMRFFFEISSILYITLTTFYSIGESISTTTVRL